MFNLNLGEEELLRVKQEIQEFIKKEISNAGVEGAVLGLSGGIDSALTAKLAVEALGSKNVKVMLMPERGVTSEQDIKDAVELARTLGVDNSIIEINSIFSSFKKAFPFSDFEPGNRDFALANLKPRVRMCLLYMAANMKKLLVIGTGNKTELLLGYFTKYGDGGVDLLPIGGLYKAQVKALAEYIELPKSFIEKPPSAGLWVGQTDEAEIGVDYKAIDMILYDHIELGLSEEEIVKKLDVTSEEVRRVLSLIAESKHKRILPKIKEFT